MFFEYTFGTIDKITNLQNWIACFLCIYKFYIHMKIGFRGPDALWRYLNGIVNPIVDNRESFLHNGISCLVKTASLYYIILQTFCTHQQYGNCHYLHNMSMNNLVCLFVWYYSLDSIAAWLSQRNTIETRNRDNLILPRRNAKRWIIAKYTVSNRRSTRKYCNSA